MINKAQIEDRRRKRRTRRGTGGNSIGGGRGVEVGRGIERNRAEHGQSHYIL